MRNQRKGEPRIEYLVRVLHEYMGACGHDKIIFDGVECDGFCLAEDFCNAVNINPEVDGEETWSWKKELKQLIDEEV